ncbi:MAG: ATP-binding protein [Bacteriovoracaceae bacterium]
MNTKKDKKMIHFEQSSEDSLNQSFQKAVQALTELSFLENLSWQERIERSLDLPLELFNLELGLINKIDQNQCTSLFARSKVKELSVSPGDEFELSKVYCDLTWRQRTLKAVKDASVDPEYSQHDCYKAFGLNCYVGIPLYLKGRPYGTISLSAREKRSEEITDLKISFFKLYARWVENAIATIEGEKKNKRTEKQLARQKAMFESVFRDNPDALVFANPDREIVLTNVAFEKMFGFEATEVRGQKTKILYAHSEDFQVKTQAKFNKENIVKNTTPYKIEYRKKDGSIFVGETVGYPITDSDGEILGFIGSIKDVSESLRIEKELRDHKKIVRHSSKLASIGQIAAGVGHEINNPLAIALGYLSGISREVEKNDPNNKTVIEKISKVRNACERISVIVKGLRTFSRSDSDEEESINLRELIKENVNMLSEIYHKEGVSLRFLCDEALDEKAIVFGNRGRLQQVLVNLLSNSKDALENQPLKEIELKLGSVGDNLVLSVKDSGPGIPQDIQDKIFEPFYTTKVAEKGTGIGLALVQTIIKEHRGKIDLNSSSEGTEFILTLPLDKNIKKLESVPEATENVRDETLYDVGIKTALVVDDEVDILELLTQMLESSGVKVYAFSSSTEALNAYLRTDDHFDLILSDFKMPELNGAELIQLIKQKPHSEMPLSFFITGNLEINLDSEQYSGLVDGYLHKPFHEGQLVDFIKSKKKKHCA